MSKVELKFPKEDYLGAKSTLCTGCGHDSVTNHIITAYYKSGISPYDVAKMSGIGCSSKTPTYFLGKSHGFNSIHGRMAPMATGAKIANKALHVIGVSGDGDTASIGLGGFAHMIRRNLPIVYIVENNGVYGLTKGQFSATADFNSTNKRGEKNPFLNIDLCSLAIDLGCHFVARSFSGDAKQLVPLLEAAIQHPGTAFIDIISPCVTFANNEGSTKAFHYVKDHKINLNELGLIDERPEMTVDYAEGDLVEIPLNDEHFITLKKLDKNFDFQNKYFVVSELNKARDEGKILTGLLYFDQHQKNLLDLLNLSQTPLKSLTEKEILPDAAHLHEVLSSFS